MARTTPSASSSAPAGHSGRSGTVSGERPASAAATTPLYASGSHARQSVTGRPCSARAAAHQRSPVSAAKAAAPSDGDRDVDEPLDAERERRVDERPVARRGRRQQAVRPRGVVACADVDGMRAAGERLLGLAGRREIPGVDLAALAQPLRQRTVVARPQLPFGVAEDPAGDRRAERARPVGDEDPVHWA